MIWSDDAELHAAEAAAEGGIVVVERKRAPRANRLVLPVKREVDRATRAVSVTSVAPMMRRWRQESGRIRRRRCRYRWRMLCRY